MGQDERKESLTEHPCITFKEQYDKCFTNWYRYSYIVGNYDNGKALCKFVSITSLACDHYFEEYSHCLSHVLRGQGISDLTDASQSLGRLRDRYL